MADKYYIDLSLISLSDYEKEIEGSELLPSRMILKEDTKQRFQCLQEHGITNLEEIVQAFSTPKKITEFAGKIGLPEEYLKILKREVASFHPDPVKLDAFPHIEKKTVLALAQEGIKDSQQFFNLVLTEEDRQTLSEKTGIAMEEILELTKLVDVARIRWVGANFARLLVDSGCDTVEKVKKADYKELHAELMRINEEKKYFKGKFGVNDMKLTVLAAQSVPAVVRY